MYKASKFVRDTIDQLQELYPIAFPKKPLPKVPLAKGITKEIQDALGLPRRLARAVLRAWCQGKRWKDSCVTGAPKYRLNGSTRGTVTEQQVYYVHRELKIY